MQHRLTLPCSDEEIRSVRIGDELLLSGKLYIGRDQVHLRLKKLLDEGAEQPFSFEGNAIYYMGPSATPDGYVIGACGPTTSARMDPFSPSLMEAGLRIMIGKGPRSQSVYDAIVRFHGLYLQAYGGCGALYASCIRSVRTIAWPELGPEALTEAEIEDFPVICIADSEGGILTRR